MAKQRRLDGMDDILADELFDLTLISGDEAYDKLDSFLRRITPKRLEASISLLKIATYFGARIRFLHREDLDDEDLEHCWCYTDECGTDTLGTYCHLDAWISIPLDRHKGWVSVENTLRHEIFHLMQDVCDDRPREDERDLPLLTDKLRWGNWLAESVLKEFEDSDLPLCEAEAHSADHWPKICLDWFEEVKRTEIWVGRWYCPV